MHWPLPKMERKNPRGKKPSREISVDQIRDLSSFANLSAHCGGYRIVVIHPAEAMNSNAANSLLKTLEEPTDKLLFLLVTHKPQQLLPTILSRCLSFAVHTPTREVGVAWLAEQGVKNPEHALAQTGFAPLQALGLGRVGRGCRRARPLAGAPYANQPNWMHWLLPTVCSAAPRFMPFTASSNGVMIWPVPNWRVRYGTIPNRLPSSSSWRVVSRRWR